MYRRARNRAAQSTHADYDKRQGKKAARPSEKNSSDEDVAEKPNSSYRRPGGQRPLQTAGPSKPGRYYAPSDNGSIDEEDPETDNHRSGEEHHRYATADPRNARPHHSERDRSPAASRKRHFLIRAAAALFPSAASYPAGRYRQTSSRSAAGKALHTERGPSPGRSAKDERRQRRKETFFAIGEVLGETIVPAISSALGKKRQQNGSDSDTNSDLSHTDGNRKDKAPDKKLSGRLGVQFLKNRFGRTQNKPAPSSFDTHHHVGPKSTKVPNLAPDGPHISTAYDHMPDPEVKVTNHRNPADYSLMDLVKPRDGDVILPLLELNTLNRGNAEPLLNEEGDSPHCIANIYHYAQDVKVHSTLRAFAYLHLHCCLMQPHLVKDFDLVYPVGLAPNTSHGSSSLGKMDFQLIEDYTLETAFDSVIKAVDGLRETRQYRKQLSDEKKDISRLAGVIKKLKAERQATVALNKDIRENEQFIRAQKDLKSTFKDIKTSFCNPNDGKHINKEIADLICAFTEHGSPKPLSHKRR